MDESGIGTAPPAPPRPETMVEAARAHALRYAPAYLRASLYVVSNGIINFGDTFGKLTPEDTAKLSVLGWACLILRPANAMILAAIAFLDQTLARINAARAEQESRPPFARPPGN